MEKAWNNYLKKSTTIVQRREDISESKPPVFMICPDPPFKTSFFTDLGMNDTMGAEKYFWVNPLMMQNIFKNDSYTTMDLYMKMSYQLELDMNIFVHRYFLEYVYF